jgi:hypothetical protein
VTPTLKRLGQSERWLWFTWRGWLAALCAVGVLYAAVKLSPLGFRATVTIALLALTALGMLLWGVCGRALAPERYLLAVVRYKRSAKTLTCPGQPDRLGLVLDTMPPKPSQRAESPDPASPEGASA